MSKKSVAHRPRQRRAQVTCCTITPAAWNRLRSFVFQRIFTQAIFSYLIVNKRIKCYFRENPSGYKSLTLEKSAA
jgi:hypothetical protein